MPTETPHTHSAGEADAAAGREPLLDTVRHLAFPRFAGGAGERAAGEFLRERLLAEGLDVNEESFRTGRHAVFRLQLFAHAIGAFTLVSMSALAPEQPGGAALLALVSLLLVAGAGRWRSGLEGAFDVGRMVESRNIIGRRPGRAAGALRIVVMAHLDSKSSAWPTAVPAVVLLTVGAFLLTLGVAAAWAWGRGDTGPNWMIPAAALGTALVAIPFNRSGDRSPGAMDNATGLAVLLASARGLPQDEKLSEAELVFLGTGAEELGLAGAVRWIQAHADELDVSRTVFINVDSVGIGKGMFGADVRGFAPGGEAMRGVLQAAARTVEVPLRILPMLPAAGVDTMPISARGFATATLLGEVTGRAAWRIHTQRDTPEHLNEEAIRSAVRMVHAAARRVVGAGG